MEHEERVFHLWKVRSLPWLVFLLQDVMECLCSALRKRKSMHSENIMNDLAQRALHLIHGKCLFYLVNIQDCYKQL